MRPLNKRDELQPFVLPHVPVASAARGSGPTLGVKSHVSVLGRFNEIFRHRILSEMMHDMTASPIEGGSSLELNRTKR